MRRVLTLVVAVCLWLLVALPALAGGAWMTSPRERVEPGEEVALVGYVDVDQQDQLEKQWMASLNVEPLALSSEGRQSQWLPLGPVTIEATGIGGYLSHRASITFTVPSDLAPGVYQVQVGNWEEGDFLGDLIGAILHVGVEPDHPENHEWALDEPLIAELPGDALITGPFEVVTAGELRQGIYPANPEQFMLDPANLPTDYQVKQSPLTTTAPAPTITAAPPTTAGSGAEEPPSLTTSAIPPATTGSSEDPDVLVEEESQGVLEPLALAVALVALIGVGLLGLRRRRREIFEAVGEEEPLVRVGE